MQEGKAAYAALLAKAKRSPRRRYRAVAGPWECSVRLIPEKDVPGFKKVINLYCPGFDDWVSAFRDGGSPKVMDLCGMGTGFETACHAVADGQVAGFDELLPGCVPFAFFEEEGEFFFCDTRTPAYPVLFWNHECLVRVTRSLEEFLDELFGLVEKPAVALEKRLAAFAAEMEKDGTEKTAYEALDSLIGMHAAGAADAAVREQLGHACALAGDCARKLGDTAAVRRHYRAGAGFGSMYAARTLVRFEEAARDWPALLEAGELFFPEAGDLGLAFTWKDRALVMRCRVLARSMLDDAVAAGAAFDILETQYSNEDAYGALLEDLLQGLRGPGLPDAAAVLAARVAGALAAWKSVREGTAALDDRAWWESLDDAWKIVLLANCNERLPEMQIAFQGAVPEVDADMLAAVLMCRTLKICAIRHEYLDEDGEEDYEFLHVRTFAPLARLRQLENLSAADNQVHYSLSPLAGLVRLRVLDLAGTRVDDLGPLAGHQALEELSIKDSDVRDLSPLAGLPRLRVFNCWRTRVADLAPLESVVSLEHLVIGNLPATRLPLFAGLEGLQTLEIGYDRFDRKDIAAFKKLHPQCRIVK